MPVKDLQGGSQSLIHHQKIQVIIIFFLLFPTAVLLQGNLNQVILAIERAMGRDVYYIQVQKDYWSRED